MAEFNTEQSLEEIYSELINYLKEGAEVRIGSVGIEMYIPENGDDSWWFDDLVRIILQKAANGDKEIIKLCLDKKIDLFDIKTEKRSKNVR